MYSVYLLVHCSTMYLPYQRPIAELWIKIGIYGYSPFLFVHVEYNSCKCIWLDFFNMLHIWFLSVRWSSIITPNIFCYKLLSILTPLISVLRLLEVTVVKAFLLLTRRWIFLGLAFKTRKFFLMFNKFTPCVFICI